MSYFSTGGAGSASDSQKLIPTSETEPCVVCGNTTGHDCFSEDRSFVLCHNYPASKGLEINGYRSIGQTKDGQWGEFVLVAKLGEKTSAKRVSGAQVKQEKSKETPSADLSVEQIRFLCLLRDGYFKKNYSAKPLHPDDRADLIRRGLTDREIEVFGAVSVEGKEPGYVYPIVSPDGLVIGAAKRLRNPVSARYKWVFLAGSSKLQDELPLSYQRPATEKPTGIAIVEGTGAKSFILANKSGKITIGAGAAVQFANSKTIWKWFLQAASEETGSKLIDFFPDSGSVKNSSVFGNYQKFFEFAVSLGYSIRVAWWGQIEKGADVDDLAAEQFESIDFIEVPEFEAIAKEYLPEPEVAKTSKAAQKAQAKEKARQELKDSDEIDRVYQFEDRAVPSIVSDNLDLITGTPTADWICVLGKMRRWCGTHYEEVPDGVFKNQILAFLKRLFDWGFESDPTGAPIPLKKFKYGTDKVAQECLATVKTDRFVPISQIPRKGLNLANGTLLLKYVEDFPVFELTPHRRDLYYLSCSEVSYDPNADTTQADLLLKALRGDQLETFLRHQSFLFDFPGATKRLGRPRAGICEGGGSNGKDSVRGSIEKLVGSIGCFSFEDFKAYDEGRRFNLSTLPNYQYSWASENTAKVKLENLKSLISAIPGNSPLWAERKGQDAESYIPQLSLWFSLNKAPITEGFATFIRSRFAIYQFDKSYSNNPTSPDELLADPRFSYDSDFLRDQVCPGLLNRLIEAYQKLWVDGIDWEPCNGRLLEWAKESNHLLSFAEDVGLISDPEGTISVSEIYSHLLTWYEANDYLEIRDGTKRWSSPPSQYDKLVVRPNELYARLKAVFRVTKETDTTGTVTGGKNRAYFKGLTLKPLSQVEPEPETKELSQQAPIEPSIAADPEPAVNPAEFTRWIPNTGEVLEYCDFEDKWHRAEVLSLPRSQTHTVYTLRRIEDDQIARVTSLDQLRPVVFESLIAA